MKAHMHRGDSGVKSPTKVIVEMTPREAGELADGLGTIISTIQRVDPARKEFNVKAMQALNAIFDALTAPYDPGVEQPDTPAPEAQGRPDLHDRIAIVPPEPVSGPIGPVTPAPEGQRVPSGLEAIASHILPHNREFTVRVYQCDASLRRHQHETQARTFPAEDKARDFCGRVQNIQNMKVRAGEAPAFVVVLGVQDSRKHAKKKSYREVESFLCKGRPG